MRYMLTVYNKGNNAMGVYVNLEDLKNDLSRWVTSKGFQGCTIERIN